MSELSNKVAWDSYEFYTKQLFDLEEDHLVNMDKVTNLVQGGSYCSKQDHLKIFKKSFDTTSQLIVLYNKQLSSIDDMIVSLSEEEDDVLKNSTFNSLTTLVDFTSELLEDTNKYRKDLSELIKQYEER
jgi:uncharacterized protein YaaN involved in tellurite resistance